MKPNAIKSVLAAAVCLASMHSQAQNVSKLAIELQSQRQQMWSVGRVNQADSEIKTQEIYKRTLDFLKSPNRVQKMGGMDGGGGNALLCEENGRFTAELLDIYEARSLGVQFELGGKNNMLEILDHVFNRLSKVSPLRATVYSAMARDLLSKDTQWVANKHMPVIDDVNLTLIPQGCLLVQVAIQRPIEQQDLPNAKTYIIDSEVFNLLDDKSKAALVLHEILYREARYSKIPDSIFTRELVGLLMSKKISEMKLNEVNKLYLSNSASCYENIETQSYSIGLNKRQSTYSNDACEFINKIQYQINYSNSTQFNLINHSYIMNEKWLAKSGIRYSHFNYGVYDSHTPIQFHKTTITLDGKIQFESVSTEFEKSKTPILTIKNGTLVTMTYFEEGTKKGFDYSQLNVLEKRITPYSADSLNHFGSIDGKKTITNINKIISADKINFQLNTIILDNQKCKIQLEDCKDSVVIEFNSQVNALELRADSGILKIYHRKENQEQAYNKIGIVQNINNEWVSVEAVRFNSSGNISEYGIKSLNSKSDLLWIKYQ